MPAYDVFFYGALFFLVGIFLKSLGMAFSGIFLLIFFLEIVFLILFFVYKKNFLIWQSVLAMLVLAGGFYFEIDGRNFEKNYIVFDKKLSFSGIVVNNPLQKENVAEFKLRLLSPYYGNVLARLPAYPSFEYGDEIILKGIIQKPFSESYGRYLAKEDIIGVIAFPQVELINKNKGSKIKSALFNFRNKMMASFKKVLPFEEAAFLGGLTLGGRSDFSNDFKEAMKKSGTTHLVALSGYNITIIVWAIMGIFTIFFARGTAFAIAVIIVIGFVLMTGAEASVVRASVMGLLMLLAGQIGRVYDTRNALIFAGLLMVLQNPKILVFDLGFQFSFLALLGIIYLRPAIQKFFNISGDLGFLSLKDHFLNTTSAQLAVAPILIFSTHSFSMTSLLANLLILETIPITMFFGFLVAGFSLVSYYLSMIFGWIVWPLLAFQIFVIELFAKFSWQFNPDLSVGAIAAYYAFFMFFIFYTNRPTAQ